jgi:hypothetical protein
MQHFGGAQPDIFAQERLLKMDVPTHGGRSHHRLPSQPHLIRQSIETVALGQDGEEAKFQLAVWRDNAPLISGVRRPRQQRKQARQ